MRHNKVGCNGQLKHSELGEIDGKTVSVTAVYPKTDQIVVRWPTGEETYRSLSGFVATHDHYRCIRCGTSWTKKKRVGSHGSSRV